MAKSDRSIPVGGALPTQYIIRGKFNPAIVVRQIPIAAAAAGPVSTRIDLSDLASGPYTLETDLAGATPRNIYLNDYFAGKGAPGVTDIHWETSQTNAPVNGQRYVIRFRKR